MHATWLLIASMPMAMRSSMMSRMLPSECMKTNFPCRRAMATKSSYIGRKWRRNTRGDTIMPRWVPQSSMIMIASTSVLAHTSTSRT